MYYFNFMKISFSKNYDEYNLLEKYVCIIYYYVIITMYDCKVICSNHHYTFIFRKQNIYVIYSFSYDFSRFSEENGIYFTLSRFLISHSLTNLCSTVILK